MTLRLIFSSPTLPALLGGEDFRTYVGTVHQQLNPNEPALGIIASEMDNYGRLRNEYDQRNAHYSEWIQWSNNNPGGKEQLLAFMKDHRAQFDGSCTALEKIEAAFAASPELADNASLRTEIQQMLDEVRAGARLLAQNIDVIIAPEPQSEQSAKTAESGGPKILPQKRPRPEQTST